MKRLLAAIVAVLLPTGLVFGVLWATSKPGLPAAAQARLSQYLQNPTTVSQQPYRVQQISQASQPWNFNADTSGPSFGDSVIFQTTHNQFGPPPAWPLGTMTSGSSPGSMQGAQPLPYPPRELWCVRLARATSGETRIIFVALHEDLYNADWIVHEAPPSATGDDLVQDLSAVGCNLGLGH
jgi:hypothetical protein